MLGARSKFFDSVGVDDLVFYLLMRQNGDGGFCFYRLDESNLSDTFYAVAILSTLDKLQEANVQKTAQFLKSNQCGNGGYQSQYAAWYSIKGLYLIGEKPAMDPSDYLLRQLAHKQLNSKTPVEVLSAFESYYYLIEALKIVGELPSEERIMEDILGYRTDEGGFGLNNPDLISTFHAVSILSLLRYDLKKLRETAKWVKQQEEASGGFTMEPSGMLALMDETYYGLKILELTYERPKYIRETMNFIADCQNANGGFRRARASGISTFESSFYAIEALKSLSKWL